MIVMVAVCFLALIGMAALVIDVGELHSNQTQIQLAADAAALAGAANLSQGSSVATQDATNYGAAAGANLITGVTDPTPPTAGCLQEVSPTIPCPGGPGFGSPTSPAQCVALNTCNAVRVTESETVSPFVVLADLGIGARTVSATATAAAGAVGVPTPLDVEVIVDTTASMQDKDDCTVTSVPNPSQEDCAKAGVAALLGLLPPCAGTCVSSPLPDGNVSNPADRVGLMIFPALSSKVSPGSGPYYKGVPDETDCSKEIDVSDLSYALNPSFYPSLAGVGGNGPSSGSAGEYSNYQAVPFSSDFRTSDAATTLNPASALVDAVDWNQCSPASYGLEDPGGLKTYYADAITEAQATFASDGRSGGGVQDAIILLSDGDANETGASGQAILTGSLDPSATDECQAGIAAAEKAEAAGTLVFTIAYGALNSGCASDSGGPNSTPPDFSNNSPMCTMQLMANNSVTNTSYANDTAAEAALCTTSDPSSGNQFYNSPTGAELESDFKSIGKTLLEYSTSTLVSNSDT